MVRVSGGRRRKGGGVGVSESQSKHKEPKAAPVGCKYLHVPAGGVCLSALLLFCTETTIKRCDNKERLQPPLPLVVIESHCSTSHILTLQTGSGEEPQRTSENRNTDRTSGETHTCTSTAVYSATGPVARVYFRNPSGPPEPPTTGPVGPLKNNEHKK